MPFDAHDLVAAGDQIAQRRDDRQAGADVRLEQEVALAPLEHLHQRRVAAPRQRVRPLVRRDDVQVRLDERRIGVDDRRADGAVDQRGVGQLHLADPPRERRGVHPVAAPLQLRPSSRRGRCRSASATNRLLLASADDGDVEALRQQIRPLLLQLPQHRAADVADADHRERQPLASSRRTPGESRSARAPAATRRSRTRCCAPTRPARSR